MRIINIIILLFLLTAFTIGISVQDSDFSTIDNSINNASQVIENISITPSVNSSIPNMEGLFLILEKYIKFVGTFALEIMRAGITFGHDNPDYFEPSSIIYVIKLIIILLIISLLIKPVMYLVIFIIMIGMWIKDKLKKRRENEK